MIEQRLKQVQDETASEVAAEEKMSKASSEHSYSPETLDIIQKILARLKITTQSDLNNVKRDQNTREEFKNLDNELGNLLKQAEVRNKGLPSSGVDDASLDQKVKEALDINLLDICEKKEVAESKLRELTKQFDSKVEKVKQLEYENYLLQKKNKEFEQKFIKADQDLKKKTQDVERLLDILYGTDKAKEYAKLDAESWNNKQIRAYHIGPPVHVMRSMHSKNQGITSLKQNEPNYCADGHNEIWKTQEENLVKEEKEDDSLETFTKTGLWVLKNTQSMGSLPSENIPVSDQIKNHYNTLMFNQQNPESTFDTDMFARTGSSGQDANNHFPNTPGFDNTQNGQSPHFGAQRGPQMPQRSGRTGYSNSGFRLTFNDKNQ
ncbi:unnamed protein product [Moneuplotes crassus]|uniref:Uncharacterized protein n=1 Tax=Euplotes crassus TaxID=5936 RepID=A0AAD1XFZ0_EUPCR|nr:unnamed protein product [Moneuplotes crassus]